MDKKKLALIHIVKKELGLSDEEYRAILHKVAGKDSARDIDNAGFRALMNYFVRSEYYRINPHGMTIRQKLFIKSLAQGLGWDEGHLTNFIRKYYHESSIDQLTGTEASNLIESLKKIKVRSKFQA